MERKDNKGRLLAKGEYQRRDGYEYRYADPLTGAVRSVWAKTLTELRRKEKGLRDNVDAGVGRKGRTTTVDECFDVWVDRRSLDVAAGLLRQHTLDGYVYLWNSLARGSMMGKCRIALLTTELIQDHYRAMLAAGLAIGTVETLQTVVSQVVKHAYSQGWCSRDVSRGASTTIRRAARKREEVEGKHDHPHCLEPRERDALLEELKEPRWAHYAPIVRLLLHTGLRAGELCGLLPEDVSEDSIWVRRDLRYTHDADGHKQFLQTPPKSPRSRREVLLTDEAKRDLADWRALGKACVQEVCGLRGLLFCKPRGSALTYAAINKELHRIARAANERAGREVVPEGITCHWLRHTHITDAIDAGVPVQVVAALVGHEGVDTTWRCYYTCRRSTVEQGVEIMNRAARSARTAPVPGRTGAGFTLLDGGCDTKNAPNVNREIVGSV